MEAETTPPIDYIKEVSELIGISSFQGLCDEMGDCKICGNIVAKFCSLARAADVDLWPCIKVLTRFV